MSFGFLWAVVGEEGKKTDFLLERFPGLAASAPPFLDPPVPTRAKTQQRAPRDRGVPERGKKRSNPAHSTHLSIMILWWCWPPAFPRPPGCLRCFPTRPWPAETWPRFLRFLRRPERYLDELGPRFWGGGMEGEWGKGRERGRGEAGSKRRRSRKRRAGERGSERSQPPIEVGMGPACSAPSGARSIRATLQVHPQRSSLASLQKREKQPEPRAAGGDGGGRRSSRESSMIPPTARRLS